MASRPRLIRCRSPIGAEQPRFTSHVLWVRAQSFQTSFQINQLVTVHIVVLTASANTQGHGEEYLKARSFPTAVSLAPRSASSIADQAKY